MDPDLSQREAYEDPPPFLRSWPRVYAAALLYTFALILALYLVTRLLGS